MPITLIDENVVFSSADKYFFDTNIWKVIHSPVAIPDLDDPIVESYREYPAALEKIKKAGAQIYVSPILLSEYFNMRLNQEFEEWQSFENKPEYTLKQFRRELYSSEYAPIIKNVHFEIKQILKDATLVPDIHNVDEINKAIERLGQQSLDVNDTYYYGLCEKNGYIFVTHDTDFKRAGVNVLTANKKLIKR